MKKIKCNNHQLSTINKSSTTISQPLSPNSQKGMAIVLAMGVIMMVFLLGMLFTTKSMLDRKSTQNYNSLQVARMTARSALHRAIARINVFGENVSSIYSTDPTSKILYSKGTKDATDSLSKLLETDTEGANINKTKYTSVSLSNIEWQYLPAKHSTDTPIAARIAYFVEPEFEFGKVNINACIDTGYMHFKNKKIKLVNEGEEVRNGVDLSEVSLFALINPKLKILNKELNKKSKNFLKEFLSVDGGGKLPLPKIIELEDKSKIIIPSKWNSIEMVNRLLKTNLTDIEEKDFEQLFTFDSKPSPEAFLMTDKDGTDTKLYHRFNLARNADYWNNISVSKLSAQAALYTETDVNIINNGGMPWVTNWNSSAGMGSKKSNKNQILANLIDYSDANSIPTTDATDTATPSYVGLEKVPYINEVNIKFTCDVTFEEKQYQSNTAWFSVYPEELDVELVGMYEEAMDNYQVELEVSMDYEYEVCGEKVIVKDLEKVLTKKISKKKKSDKYFTFTTGFTKLETKKQDKTEPLLPYIQWWPTKYINMIKLSTNYSKSNGGIKNLKITSLKVKLSKNNNKFTSLIDYSYIVDSDHLITTATGDTALIADQLSLDSHYSFVVDKDPNLNIVTKTSYIFNSQVDDPRQNLLRKCNNIN
jgi:hypothetical protein